MLLSHLEMDSQEDVENGGCVEFASSASCKEPNVCPCFGSGLCSEDRVYMEIRPIYDFIPPVYVRRESTTSFLSNKSRDDSTHLSEWASDWFNHGEDQGSLDDVDADDEEITGFIANVSFEVTGTMTWFMKKMLPSCAQVLFVTYPDYKTPLIELDCLLRIEPHSEEEGSEAISPTSPKLREYGWVHVLSDSNGNSLYLKIEDTVVEAINKILRDNEREPLITYDLGLDIPSFAIALAPCLNYNGRIEKLMELWGDIKSRQERPARVTVIVAVCPVSVHGGRYPNSIVTFGYVVDIATDPGPCENNVSMQDEEVKANVRSA